MQGAFVSCCLSLLLGLLCNIVEVASVRAVDADNIFGEDFRGDDYAGLEDDWPSSSDDQDATDPAVDEAEASDGGRSLKVHEQKVVHDRSPGDRTSLASEVVFGVGQQSEVEVAPASSDVQRRLHVQDGAAQSERLKVNHEAGRASQAAIGSSQREAVAAEEQHQGPPAHQTWLNMLQLQQRLAAFKGTAAKLVGNAVEVAGTAASSMKASSVGKVASGLLARMGTTWIMVATITIIGVMAGLIMGTIGVTYSPFRRPRGWRDHQGDIDVVFNHQFGHQQDAAGAQVRRMSTTLSDAERLRAFGL